jgi:hypothetical protein
MRAMAPAPGYYLLECEEPLSSDGEALLEIHNTFRVGEIRLWKSGKRHTRPVPEPIEVRFETFRGYDGPPVELLDLGIPLMSARLAQALVAAGVSNLDLYAVRLVHEASGRCFDYRAFNVVGLVAAADLAHSEWTSLDGPPSIDGSFTSLVLDEAACGGRLLFRLAENVNALVVAASVRAHLLAAGFDTLRFREPRDWVQL